MQEENNYSIMESFLSVDRMNKYLRLTDGDKYKAADLYMQNLNKCQVLYTRLHWLEIGLRNAVNYQLSQKYGHEWFNSSSIGLGEKEQAQIQKAKNNLQKEKKLLSNGNVIAEINFGLWVNLFNFPYDTLWRHCLRKAFKPKTGKLERKQLSKILHPILKLRNRIAHYEPILFYDLLKMDREIIDIIYMLNPDMAMLPYLSNVYEDKISYVKNEKNV